MENQSAFDDYVDQFYRRSEEGTEASEDVEGTKNAEERMEETGG